MSNRAKGRESYAAQTEEERTQRARFAASLRDYLIRRGVIVEAGSSEWRSPLVVDADGLPVARGEGPCLAIDDAGRRAAARAVRGEVDDQRALSRQARGERMH